MLNTMAVEIYHANVKKGFYEDNAKVANLLNNVGASEEDRITFQKAVKGQRLSLIHSEISEALEGIRKDKSFPRFANVAGSIDALKEDFMILKSNPEQFNELFEMHVKDTEEDELADALIRILDYCGAYQIDIDFHVKTKLHYNALRPHKHGKTF